MLSHFFNSFKTILVVEDDDVLLKSIHGALKDEGYKVVTASNGRSVIPKANREKPSLILLDLMLPDMDGMSVLRELRDASRWGEKVKVIIFSNLLGDSGLAEEAKRYNVSRYVEKNTVSLDEVLQTVSAVLKQ